MKRCIQLLFIASGSCILLWFITLVAAFECFSGRMVVGLSLGKISIGIYPKYFGYDMRFRMLSDVADNNWLTWWPLLNQSQGATVIFVPLWIPSLLFGTLGLLSLLYMERAKK